VAHLRQNRTQLREEWVVRITETRLLTAMTKEEIFAEATSVYDSHVEALETEAFEALQAYARNLSDPYEFHWRVTVPIRIVLADDHVLVRQGLKSLLEREKFQVVAEASDGQEAVRLTEAHHPDIAVLDISMPTQNGINAARELGRSCPKTKSILLTQHEEEQYIHEALEAGVKGYVLKSQVASDLVHAIQQVSRGEFYLSPGISRAVVEAYRSKSDRPADPLTVRERQVLQLIAEGKSTKDTASLLGISVKTAESHRMRLMQKLDIHETASLVRYAVRRGLVQP
jgi:two-component system response regulator NreC